MTGTGARGFSPRRGPVKAHSDCRKTILCRHLQIKPNRQGGNGNSTDTRAALYDFRKMRTSQIRRRLSRPTPLRGPWEAEQRPGLRRAVDSTARGSTAKSSRIGDRLS